MTADIRQRGVGQDLTVGPVFHRLIQFALPIVLANLIQQIYSMVDLMVIGQYVGSTGTSGVSIGGEIADFITPFATAFSTAGQIYIAQLSGAKRLKEQKEAIGSFLSFMMLIALGFMILTLLLRQPLLRMLNCPEEALEAAEIYMILTSIGFPFIFGYNAVCGVLRGMGESKRPLLFVTAAAVSNIFLDVFMVAVCHLDVAGTAIATTASQFASFFVAFLYMYKRRQYFDFSLELSYFRIRKEPIRVILALGLPQAARSMLVRVSIFWTNAQINSYGIVASSTNGIGNKLQKFLEIFSSSVSLAAGAMIGQNLGAQKTNRAKKVIYYTLASNLVFSAIISLSIFFFPHLAFGIFTKDHAVLDMGVIYLRIMIVHFFASAVTSSFQSMVIGCGNASLNFVIGIMDGIICKIGFSLFFEATMHLGVFSYFWGIALSRVIPGVICIVYFFSGAWSKRRLIK